MKAFNEVGAIEANLKKIGDYGFHGDVKIQKSALPNDFNNFTKLPDGILALGEHTGHCHKLFDGEFDLRENPKTKQKHLKIVTPCMLKHQEHKPVILQPGDYLIDTQKEYDHFEEVIRRVAD